MRMQHLLLVIEPQSAFGTVLKGDTLFGHLCWALRDCRGEGALRDRLQGYTQGRPFVVVSDPLPERHWPRPLLPPALHGDVDARERKAAKNRMWLRHDDLARPVEEWLQCMVEDPGGDRADAADSGNGNHTSPTKHEARFRNSIDRRSGTTTDEGFAAPYDVMEFWYREGTRLDCHLVYDASRIDADTLVEAVTTIGKFGYGRDATVGLGRFTVERGASGDRAGLPLAQNDSTSWLALAPVAPQGLAWNPERCWYRPFTRFGRHGNAAVHLGNPFKAPVLLADTGAVLTPREHYETRLFVGQGLGGTSQPLSRSLPETVHQGFAPVIGLRVPELLDGGVTS